MAKKEHKKHSEESGQSLIELAISLVILLILLSGIVDLGRVSFYYIAMRDAAQEGATFGSIYPNQCYAIEDRVRTNLVDDTGIVVDIKIAKRNENEDYQYWYKYDCTDIAAKVACEENVIQVTVTDPDFPITMPFLGTFLGRQSIVLQTTIRDSIIRPFCDDL